MIDNDILVSIRSRWDGPSINFNFTFHFGTRERSKLKIIGIVQEVSQSTQFFVNNH
jgi:hypothetical protein